MLSCNPSPLSVGGCINPVAPPCSGAFQLARWCLFCLVDTRKLREKPHQQYAREETFHSTYLCPTTTITSPPTYSADVTLSLGLPVSQTTTLDKVHVDKLLTSRAGFKAEAAL